ILQNVKKNITEFLGVPFAFNQSKIGRFMPPVPLNDTFKQSKNKSIRAFTLANTCPQFIYKTDFVGNDFLLPNNNISEDCLRLNMWVPDKNHTSSEGMPVIVFLYGGSFATGSASIDVYNSSILAATQNVITVNLNYRVGPLGFAYFGEDTEVKGNMGLLDQQVGLQWIYENIEFFGGDKEKITLFGHSAGAASVTAHLLSNKSHPYFSKIIVNSGAITNVWATVPANVALNNTYWLASLMNCTNITDPYKLDLKTKNEIITCMQKVNATDLNDYQFTTRDENQPPLPYTYLPIYNDTVFFKGNLFEKLKKQETKENYDAMYGRTSEEGSYFMPFLLGEDYGCGFNHTLGAKHPSNQCRGIWNHVIYFSWFSLGKFLRANFFQKTLLGTSYNADLSRTNREKAIEIFGDFMFNCDTAQFAEISEMKCGKDSYYFEFRKRSDTNPWPKWMGAMHGYELEYIFGIPYRHPENYSSNVLRKEQQYSDAVMKLYGSFAKTGKPSDNWLPFKDKDKNKCAFHNELCAIIDENLVSTNRFNPQYTNVISRKCYTFNNVANSHKPRFELKTRLYNHAQHIITQSLDQGTFDFDFPMWK
uniref:Carboxylic ester hydrolase n=1 Tax=Parastrongyloides trichosuri TaxID=131310 RepID=A0A0N4ZD50_PARTI